MWIQQMAWRSLADRLDKRANRFGNRASRLGKRRPFGVFTTTFPPFPLKETPGPIISALFFAFKDLDGSFTHTGCE